MPAEVIDRKAYGEGGTLLIADTDAHTGLDLYCLVVVAAATFTTLTATDVTGDATGQEWPAGTEIYSKAGITAITLSAGQVVGYPNA